MPQLDRAAYDGATCHERRSPQNRKAIDGEAKTELDHFGNCPFCGALIDMRDLAK
jgi:hypothetical protein